MLLYRTHCSLCLCTEQSIHHRHPACHTVMQNCKSSHVARAPMLLRALRERHLHLFQQPRADYDGSPPFWKWSKKSAMNRATETRSSLEKGRGCFSTTLLPYANAWKAYRPCKPCTCTRSLQLSSQMRLMQQDTSTRSQDPSTNLETVVDVPHDHKKVWLPNNALRVLDSGANKGA